MKLLWYTDNLFFKDKKAIMERILISYNFAKYINIDQLKYKVTAAFQKLKVKRTRFAAIYPMSTIRMAM